MSAPELRQDFYSDNASGACPEALNALVRANEGFAASYGDDGWTAWAARLVRELFETDCSVFFCFTGTAANSMALAHLCAPYHSVACHRWAHADTDEAGGPEFFGGGIKLVPIEGTNGKLDPDGVRSAALRRTDVHYPKMRAVTITQSTEVGTVYSPTEVAALGEAAREHGLTLHMDGARFANAVAALDVAPKEITWQAGVGVMSLGGTKNGLPGSEAVVFFDRELADEFEWRRKQAAQLASKMRFLTAPWVGALEDGAWLRHARHANACARRLGAAVAELPGLELAFPVQANAVFVSMSAETRAAFDGKGWSFCDDVGPGGVRLVCSWRTSDEELDQLIDDLRSCTR